ncbi:single-stranded-DNA-specific exonuclease RecJ [Chiayiivirga flava]|uniref:Single-stranded-DNA-specific exonuclease RecJ n=1 Tax=Chiayiivirga flava TaxID=659595 RepID=A0A7W8D5F7_9GAMM|nr:single-stranded-DNA-specific exonuclease [Chiayiivirga flava]
MPSPTRIRRRAPATGLDQCHALHPVLRRVYAARGLASQADTEPRLAALLAPSQLGGLDAAVELLQTALRDDARILVIGDFDADGATGTAVAVRGLRLLGARNVGFRLPHRMTHGYGLSPELVADLGEARPDLLLTVDSGIACLRGVAAARAAGLRVIVTDHHLPGNELPVADAIVNPNLRGDAFPSKALAGVGVVFYLLLALRARLRAAGWFATRGIAEPDLSVLLDLVALGTVADMVPLDANNRVLVAAGLKRLRAGHGQPGVRALIDVAGRRADRLNASDLGYSVAPRLNAAGRLDDMSLGVECLLCDDPAVAATLAAQLHAINSERRDLQQQMLEQADAMVQRWLGRVGGALPHGVAVFDAQWHPGVIGLVASKLKDSLHRPVIAFAPGGDDGLLRGSARSIRGFHIRDALADLAAADPDLIVRFGGHAMAAGLTLAPSQLPRFTTAFDALAAHRLDAAALQAELWTDGALDRGDLCRALAEDLRYAGPWGQGFPEPVFDDEFTVESWKTVGTAHLKLTLRHRDGGEPLDAIEFDGWRGDPPPARVHLAYQLELDDWRDRHGVQLLVRLRLPAHAG